MLKTIATVALAAMLGLLAVAPVFADNNNGNNSNNPPATNGGGGGGEKHPPASTPGNSPK
jgi:hypothetical protein